MGLALQEVNKTTSFISETLYAYEQERSEHEKKIKELTGKVSKMKEKAEELENKIDRQEQHSRQNFILTIVYGFNEI